MEDEKHLGHYEEVIQRVRELSDASRFTEAAALADEAVKEYPAWSDMWRIRGRMLTLSDVEASTTAKENLAEAKRSYETAKAISPFSSEPLLDLGAYKYIFEEDSEAAVRDFDAAASKCYHHLREALVGLARCYKELKLWERYRDVLDQIKNCFPDEYKLITLDI
jgi:hypothetical protein